MAAAKELSARLKDGVEWFPFGQHGLQVANEGVRKHLKPKKNEILELTEAFIQLARDRGNEYFNEHFEETKKTHQKVK